MKFIERSYRVYMEERKCKEMSFSLFSTNINIKPPVSNNNKSTNALHIIKIIANEEQYLRKASYHLVHPVNRYFSSAHIVSSLNGPN